MTLKRFFEIMIPVVLFLWGSYCMLRSYGYGDEVYRVPLHEEYLYQYSDTEWVNPYLVKWQVPTNTEWKNPYTHQNPDWQNPLTAKPKVSQKQIAKWQRELEFHMNEATRTYQDAYDKAWWIPDMAWRTKARQAWQAAFASLGATGLTMKLVMVVGTMLMQYGLECADQYEYIEQKLKWCEYHLGECEKYTKLINGG